MKKTLLVLISSFISFYCYSQRDTITFYPNKIVVKLKDTSILDLSKKAPSFKDKEVKKLLKKYNIKKIGKRIKNHNDSELKRIYVLEFYGDEQALMDSLKKFNTLFEYVELLSKPILNPECSDQTYAPTDYDQNDMWYVDAIGLREAWYIAKGKPKINIAVIDNGFDVNHVDLQPNISYVVGWNQTQEHGTLTAGLIGMAPNNGIGYCGVAGENCSLMLYRYYDGNNKRILYDEIVRATDAGARIISMSLVMTCSPSQADQDLINYAYNKGVILVAAAGNGPQHCGDVIGYPAGYDHVINVAATDRNDIKACSAFYADIDISAPGADMMSSKPNNDYRYCSCTSAATPVVAGILGLCLSVNPWLAFDALEFIIKTTSDGIYHLPGNAPYINKLGVGRINARNSVRKAASVHFQNVNIPGTGTLYSQYDIYAGENILNPLNIGVTTIKSTANITFEATGDIYLEGGFEVELGATFETK